ncbi:MAG: hypothetical protein SAJ11_12795 [Jaaginema sp. PMC 1078.18]|nr:hypothetical protein [Jaaginema sp. PMC 1078.18]
MNGLHQNLIALDRKIDGLYTAIEQLNQQVAMLVARDQECSPLITPVPPIPQSRTHHRLKSPTESQVPWSTKMTHKDILLDDSDWEQIPNLEPESAIPNDLQVRRLTAQVTAAYNRIAALEEQLLARRSQSSV